ncbi:E3 SUMO-protein ligase SIZ2 [Frankliniella fusca]|uniref:E3 SUMO-protein ligase SIZ2 n=1 Tax=Frankliniella fusca TaxID=407009 RepID=A0AAE1HVI2_9NEOP|nr:E3 SUMO-protein ligase SIZ2 [Frankliniella fusca]
MPTITSSPAKARRAPFPRSTKPVTRLQLQTLQSCFDGLLGWFDYRKAPVPSWPCLMNAHEDHLLIISVPVNSMKSTAAQRCCLTEEADHRLTEAKECRQPTGPAHHQPPLSRQQSPMLGKLVLEE